MFCLVYINEKFTLLSFKKKQVSRSTIMKCLKTKGTA